MKHLYKNQKQLSAKENFALARLVQQGDRKAREKMIEGNSGLGYRYALKSSQLNRAHCNIRDDDLLSAAMLGICEAVDRYDPDRGFAFSTYAVFWIRKCIGDCVVQSHWNTLKPPKKMIDSYMRRMLEENELDDYQNAFISRSWITEDSRIGEDPELDSIADIRRLLPSLEPLEQIVMYAELGDADAPIMSDKDYAEVLESAFDKLQKGMS